LEEIILMTQVNQGKKSQRKPVCNDNKKIISWTGQVTYIFSHFSSRPEFFQQGQLIDIMTEFFVKRPPGICRVIQT